VECMGREMGGARRGRGRRWRSAIVAITMSVTKGGGESGEEEDGCSFNSGQSK
jgi:hypothetical protein